MSSINYVSKETLESMREELNRMKTSGRAEIARQIAEAREKGDLKENAEYDAAKEAQGMHEARMAELEQAIINKLQSFLLELGKGFSFVSRQERISLDGEHFYIDLVFYNYILKCFVLIDLKTGKLTHQDIGQIDTYVRYYEDKVKQEGDNPTIGLILCSEKNNAVVKYSLLNESKQIFASKYMTYLPTEEELQAEIERERIQIEQEKKLNI